MLRAKSTSEGLHKAYPIILEFCKVNTSSALPGDALLLDVAATAGGNAMQGKGRGREGIHLVVGEGVKN